MKLSPTQIWIIEKLREGNFISHFRGIGTRFKASACIETDEGKHLHTISLASVHSMHKNNLLITVQREGHHSKYALTELGKTINID